MMSIAYERGYHRFEWDHKRRNGAIFPVEISLTRIPNLQEQHLFCVWRDITARKQAEAKRLRLEARLRQAQKMEALGTLAGGIAHDFNNILGVISGYTEMALSALDADHELRGDLELVLSAGWRAKALVAQILAFSRQSGVERRIIAPGPIVSETIRLLRSTIPSMIEVHQDIAESRAKIKANPTQLEQVVMNLCTNAYQAMAPQGGALSVTLKDQKLSRAMSCHGITISPGSYVCLIVSDTGPGVPPEHHQRVFDPFFTTKAVGKGTGMGLAMVHGIIQHHDGVICLESQVGEGATFKVYFPQSKGVEAQDVKPDSELPRGEERILLIDDERLLLDMNQRFLERLGYTVTAVTESPEALRLFKEDPRSFDLVITDQTMPKLTGCDLSRAILEARPNMPIILNTGYNNQTSEAEARALGIRGFIMKPVAQGDLARLIRRALEPKAT